MSTLQITKQDLATRLVEHIAETDDQEAFATAVTRLVRMPLQGLLDLAKVTNVDIESDIETALDDEEWWHWGGVEDDTCWFSETIREFANHPRVKEWMATIPRRHQEREAHLASLSPIEYIITDPEWMDWVILNKIRKTVSHDPRVIAHADHPRVAAWMKRVEEVEVPKLRARVA